MTAAHVVSRELLTERREMLASMLGEIGVKVDRVSWRFDPDAVLVLMRCWQDELDEIRRLLGSDQ